LKKHIRGIQPTYIIIKYPQNEKRIIKFDGINCGGCVVGRSKGPRQQTLPLEKPGDFIKSEGAYRSFYEEVNFQ